MSGEIETWIPVAGFDGYEVSDLGRVRSFRCPRHLHHRRATARALKPMMSPGQRYHRVSLHDAHGRRTDKMIHRLVAAAFVAGRTDVRREVNHIDGDRTNNAASNLEWVSRKENMGHALALGLWSPEAAGLANTRPAIGESNGRARLNAHQVVEIRRLLAAGRPVADLARAFGVAHATAQAIAARKTWRHV